MGSPSVDRQKRGGHGPVFGQQNVECPHSRPGCHGIRHDACLPEQGLQMGRKRAQFRSSTNKQDFDVRLFFEDPPEGRLVKIGRLGGSPPVDPAWNTQKRSPMRHIGEPETTVAISIQRRPARKMRVPYLHRLRTALSSGRSLLFPGIGLVLVFRRSPTRAQLEEDQERCRQENRRIRPDDDTEDHGQRERADDFAAEHIERD